MANSLSSLNREFWANETQKSLFVENSAVYVANTALRNLVAGDGDTVNNPSLSYPTRTTYTPGSDLTDTALTAANEQLTIGTWSASSVVVDDTERVQNYYAAGQLAAKRMMKSHNNAIEQAVLAEVSNAIHTIDAGNVGGSAGSSIDETTANIAQMFSSAHVKLDAVDAPMGNRIAIIGSHTREILQLQQAGRQTTLGDQVTENGRLGNVFGWEIVYNNNLPYTAVLSLATQPTNGDTLTIAGVTITLDATLAATAWADIRTNVDTTRGFIRDLINYGNGTGGTVSGTVGTDFTDVSAENRFIWQKRGLLAVNDDSADTLTITGFGDITVAETLTDATDTFTSARQDSLFLVKGAIDMIVQIPPKIEVVRVEKQFADRVKSLLGYGKKTFADGAREMVKVKINALNWR
jgi:hypothetical protein